MHSLQALRVCRYRHNQSIRRAARSKEATARKIRAVDLNSRFQRFQLFWRIGIRLSYLVPSQDATDIKFAPVRGNKADVRLEEMFKQIIERVEDLQVRGHVETWQSVAVSLDFRHPWSQDTNRLRVFPQLSKAGESLKTAN